MKKNWYFSIMVLFTITTLISCLTDSYYTGTSYYDEPSSYSTNTPNTTNNKKLRTIILDGKELQRDDIVSWVCTDRYDKQSNKVLLEFGYFLSYLDDDVHPGFVLFDGTNIGKWTIHQRQGTDQRWDWGDGAFSSWLENNKMPYAFIIKPDGTGLYYDFSMSSDGKAKPSQLYNTTRR